MDEQTYQAWGQPHRRVACGETLTAEVQAVYEAGAKELDAEEKLDGNLAELRRLRACLAEEKEEHQRLLQHSAELDAKIAALESKLDERTRHLLGIGN